MRFPANRRNHPALGWRWAREIRAAGSRARRAVRWRQPEPLRALRGHRESSTMRRISSRVSARAGGSPGMCTLITSENVADKDEFSATPIAPFDGDVLDTSAASYQKH